MTGSPPPPERLDAVARIIAEFRESMRELRCIGSQRLVRHGVSMTHFHVMAILERHGEMPMSRMAEVLDISLSNATGLVDRMEERGLVERIRVPDDRRVVLVRVTERGRQVLGQLEGFRDELIQKVLARLDPGQLMRLAETFGDLRVAVAEVIRDEPDLLAHDHPVEPARRPVPA